MDVCSKGARSKWKEAWPERKGGVARMERGAWPGWKADVARRMEEGVI